jgi:hypothetical protein
MFFFVFSQLYVLLIIHIIILKSDRLYLSIQSPLPGVENYAQLIPPFRFAMVEEGVYRGAYPTERNFRFLKR